MSDENDVATNETAPVESVVSEEAGSTERPEYIPEKFWDVDESRPNIEALGRGYGELERFVGKKRDEIRDELVLQHQRELNENRPESPEKYAALFADDSPWKELESEVHYDSDPLVKLWADTAHKAGLSNEDFSRGVEVYLDAITAGPDADEEMAKLGENGKARIEAVNMWANKNLNEEQYNALTGVAQSSEVVMALESLMNSSKSAQTGAYTPDAVSSKPSKEDIQTAMADPRYWDPGRRDAAFVRQVENMAKRMSV